MTGAFGAEDDDAPGVSQGMWCCEPPADVVLCTGEREASSLAVRVSDRFPPLETVPLTELFGAAIWLGARDKFAFGIAIELGEDARYAKSSAAMQSATSAQTMESEAHTMIHILV